MRLSINYRYRHQGGRAATKENQSSQPICLFVSFVWTNEDKKGIVKLLKRNTIILYDNNNRARSGIN
jgi:hypothetical protein